MKAKAADWGTKLVGRKVRVEHGDVIDVGGTLVGFETDGDGRITHFRVAFSPGYWLDYPAAYVEMVDAQA